MGIVDTLKKYDSKIKDTVQTRAENKAQRLEAKAQYYKKLGANKKRISKAQNTINKNSFIGQMKTKALKKMKEQQRKQQRAGRSQTNDDFNLMGGSSRGNSDPFGLSGDKKKGKKDPFNLGL